VLLFLPGPGVPLILAGLAVVGRQQHWARRLEGRLRLGAARVARRVTSRREPANRFTYSDNLLARPLGANAGLRCARDAEERSSERGGGSDGCPSTLARRAPLDGAG
jgi:hypothetical protein